MAINECEARRMDMIEECKSVKSFLQPRELLHDNFGLEFCVYSVENIEQKNKIV